MANVFKKILDRNNFLDREKRYKLQLGIVSAVFCVAGGVFTIINFLNQDTYSLGIVTGIFCFLSLLTFIFVMTLKKGRGFVEILFVVSAIIMFTYFLYTGGKGTGGFSTYWILLLPFLSMMVLGLLKGTISSLLMFLIIIFFLWIPFGKNLLLTQWQPSKAFLVRFPLVYLAAFAASFLFEISRFLTDRYADELNKKLDRAAKRDFLTGCANRHGFAEIIDNQRKKVGTPEFESAGAMLIDIDNFKNANDTFGHAFGDEVLVAAAMVFISKAGEYAVRFGGDEFVLLFENKSDFELRQIAEEIRQEITEIRFPEHPEYRFSVSIGIASTKVDKNYRVERVLELADYQSSRAKKSGKNAVYLLSYDNILGNNKKNEKHSSIFDMFNKK